MRVCEIASEGFHVRLCELHEALNKVPSEGYMRVFMTGSMRLHEGHVTVFMCEETSIIFPIINVNC